MTRITEKIKDIINEVSGLEQNELEENENLFSLGLDSLMLIQIKKKIDNTYGIDLPVAQIMVGIDTIVKIAEYVENELSSGTLNIPVEEVEYNKNIEQEANMISATHKEQWVEEQAIEEVAASSIAMQEAITGNEAVIWNSKMIHNEESADSLALKQLEIISKSLTELSIRQITAINAKKENRYKDNIVPIKQTGERELVKQEATKKSFFPKINFRAVKLDFDVFDENQKQFINKFIKRYNEKTKLSKEFAQANRIQFSDWIASLNFRMDFKELIYPIVANKSQGSKFWDLDGNEYLDMAIGYGAHFFGHRPDFIIDALEKQLKEGYITGPQTSLGGSVSKLLCEITGVERAAFANTGSEAVMAAMRIARTVTKKNKIVIFKGSYHGNFDSVLAESADGVTFPISPGTMPGMVEDVIVLDYATEESLKTIQNLKDQIAGVMVEPVQSRNPSLQPREYLHKLRRLTQEMDIALIFDEMITGFRIAPGGVQEYYGIQADIVTYGKIVGGGLPIGIVAGKAKYLDAVDGGFWNYGDLSSPEKEMTYFAGTFCKHPLSMAASKAVLEFIKEDQGKTQEQTNRLTDYFVDKVNVIFRNKNLPIKVSQFSSEFHFELDSRSNLSLLQAEMDLFFYLLMEKGIYIWERRTCFFSAAHTYEDADRFLGAIDETVDEMRKNGFNFTSAKKKNKSIALVDATDSQKRFFVLSQVPNAEPSTHLASAILIYGPLDIIKVQSAVQTIVDRHEALRTSFVVDKNQIMQRIYNKVEINVCFKQEYNKKVNQVIEEFMQPFDVFQAPLLRTEVVELSPQNFILLFDIYHAVGDGYSANIITKEFMDLYQGKKLKPVIKHYQDYIAWYHDFFSSKEYPRQVQFWRDLLPNNITAINLPNDYIRPNTNQMAGNTFHYKISEQVVQEIKKFARSINTSLYMVLLSAFNILIHKLTGETDILIGTPMTVRPTEEFDEVVGLFTNTIVLYNHVDEMDSIGYFIEQVKINCAKNYGNSELPIEALINELNIITEVNRNPLFDIMFVYENAEDRVIEMDDLKCEGYNIDINMALFDLNFEIIEENNCLQLNLYYNKKIYKESTVKSWINYYLIILDEIINDKKQKITNLLTNQMAEILEKRSVSNALIKNVSEQQTHDRSITMSPFKNRQENKTEQYLLDLCNKEFGLFLKPSDIKKNFFELGLRSINALTLAMDLEKKFQINIMDIFSHPSIEQLAEFIEGTTNSKKQVKNYKKIDKLHTERDIAIIGMSGKFPKSDDIDQLWENLLNAKECITFFDQDEIMEVNGEMVKHPDFVNAKGVLEGLEYFDSSFFEYSANEADKMDPQIRIMHEYVWKAIEDAGYNIEKYQGEIGVFLGSASNYNWMVHSFKATNELSERMENIALNDKDYLSTRISYKLNLKGPSYTVQTACSTGLTTVNLACKSISMGECDLAIAGGVTVMLPQKTGYIYEEGYMLSQDGHCRVFDCDASGTVFSDGVGIVVLKSLKQALADNDNIYAVIKSSAVNNDGARKVGYTAPSIDGQAEVIQKALNSADIDPRTIRYIETHGTGTLLGDPIEIEGLKQGFGSSSEKFCALGSLKANMGHLDAAAGVAGLIKAVMVLKNKQIPPLINFENLNPNIRLDNSPFFINQDMVEMKVEYDDNGNIIPARAGVSSFGFGGTNAHIIIEEAPLRLEKGGSGDTSSKGSQLFVLSARTKDDLNRMIEKYQEFLTRSSDCSYQDICSTLQNGRVEFKHRIAICADSKHDVLEALDSWMLQKVSKNLFSNQNKNEKYKIVFMFSGQGSQYLGMSSDLYNNLSIYREIIDDCFTIVKNCGLADAKVIFNQILGHFEVNVNDLNETQNAQLSIFIVEYSIAKTLIALGINPDYMIGHSLGEYAAACIAGVFSLEDALFLVANRAKLMQQMEKGKMIAVYALEQNILELLGESTGVSLAVVNGKENCIVSGTYEAVNQIEERLTQLNISYSEMRTSHAFHSQMMEPMLDAFQDLFGKIKLYEPEIPYISNLTGDWIQADAVIQPEYWVKHLRSTVRFYEGINTLLLEKVCFIEVGPGKILTSQVKRCENKDNIVEIINTIRHEKENINDFKNFIKNIGILWCIGETVDWGRLFEYDSVHKISLPTYPFKGQKYSFEEANYSYLVSNHSDDVQETFDHWFYRPIWKLDKGQDKIFNQNQTWVVFLREDDFNKELVALLEQYINIYKVYISDSYQNNENEFFIRPENSNDYKKMFEIIACQELELDVNIVYLWALGMNENIEIPVGIDDSFVYPLTIVKNLNISMQEIKKHFYLISSNTCHIMDEWRSDCNYSGLMKGFSKVAANENKNLITKHIDIDLFEDRMPCLNQLIDEIQTYDNNDTVALRKNNRFVASYEQIDLSIEKTEVPINRGGLYLITGGLGDLGLELAKYLYGNYKARLILLVKTALPERDSWEKILEDDNCSSVLRNKLKGIIGLEEGGCDLVIVNCDIADDQIMRYNIDQIEEKSGKINGVFHTAGLIGDGMLQFKDIGQALKVLSPKVTGTLVLDRIFADRSLDFMVLFSSMASVYGEIGQSDYASANSFLDVYAEWASYKYKHRKTISVNWDNWEEIGMAAKAALNIQSDFSVFLSRGIKPQEGMRALVKVMGMNYPQVLVSTQNIQKHKELMKQYLDLGFSGEAEGSKKIYDRPELTNAYRAPESELEQELENIWGKVFAFDKIGVDDDFMELGGDSLYALSIANQIKKKYKLDITDIFSYPTIKKLAELLSGQNSEDLKDKFENAKKVLRELTNEQSDDPDYINRLSMYQKENETYNSLDITKKKSYSHILLLGGTGYLGIYLLRQLLKKSKSKVTLIVRANQGLGLKRVTDMYQYYFENALTQLELNQIEIIEGDVTKAYFGLTDAVYHELAESVDCILNSTGKVDHYGAYDDFYYANVKSVENVIKFANEGLSKEFHHMSTKGIAVGKVADKKVILFTESDLDFGQEIDNYYSKTKIMAEKMLLMARENGLSVNIYRIGDIVFDRNNGSFQKNIDKNAIYLLVKAMVDLELIPDSDLKFLDFSFIDFTSEAIIELMHLSLSNETYHVLNEKKIGFAQWITVFEQLNISKKIVNMDTFMDYLYENYEDVNLKETIDNFITHSHFLEASDHTNFNFIAEKTNYILHKLGMNWEKPNSEQLIKMLDFGKEKNFFKY